MTMDHIRNIGSRLTSYSISNNIPNNDDIVIKGFLAKRKNMKNRYFVLRKETSRGSARLEYYDSEKKFTEGFQPKKSYTLKDCFNIGRKPDKKNYVIALYTNKECIGLVAENERELQRWLHKIQEHRNSGVEHIDGPRIEYEHVWQVEVSQRSFAVNQNLTGQHWLCLTSRFLSLVRVDNIQSKKDFQLNSILNCGYLHQFFSFELDKFSGIGQGRLLMQAEDSFIAQNIHDCVKRAMENFGRISSISESDVRRRTNSDPQSDVPCTKSRERCDSVPNNARRYPNNQGLCTSRETDQRTLDSKEEKNGSDQNGLLVKLNKDSPGFDVSRYISMTSGERHPPNSLRLSPSLACKSHSGMVSPNSGGTYNPQGMSTPVSPSIGIVPPSSGYLPMDLMPSPQGTSGGSHSCNPSQIDDAYVLMLSPGTQAPQVTRVQSRTSSPYMEMDPTQVASIERFRTTSTPTPHSLSDEDSCYEMYPNSGSSSCTSGTPSDHQIHDLAGDDRGSTPYYISWTEPHNELDDVEIIIGPRPIRTNSVGSKPDQFKRKSRLETPFPMGEPARMRAFSLGSRMSIKFGVAHHGTSGFLQGNEHPLGIWDVFPSIKEYGNHAKSKSSSAPMLGASAISHSWSGTPGAYFRGFSQSRNTGRETNLMELDFSTKKNCDLIPSEDKEKDRRSSKDRLFHTFTGSRHRSNSKSSGGSTSRLVVDSPCGSGKEKRSLESDSYSNCEIEIPFMGDNNLDDYLEVDFAPSPRNSASDSTKGYLVMHPPSFLSSPRTSTSEFLSERRGQRTTSLNDTDLDLSSSPSSCVSNDGYVEMTGGYGGSLTGLTIASSSSSSTSINALPSTASRTRRHNLVASTSITSQDLPSPIELVDGGGFGSEGRVKAKKSNNKRRSLREGPKRKISDSGSLGGETPEVSLKSKASGSFASTINNLTNLIISRKLSSSSNSTKAPLSSKGTPLPPKGSKESKSPCSSLNRIKTRDKDGCEAASHCEELYKTSCPNSISPQGPMRRRTLELMDASPPPPSDPHKGEEKMLFSPLDASRLRRQSSREAERRRSAYSTCDPVPESTSGNKSSIQVLQMSPSQKPTPIVVASSPLGTRSYVNMQPGISSPRLSPFCRDTTVSLNISQETSFPSTLLQAAPNHLAPLPSVAKSAPETNYVMMGAEDGKIKEDSAPSVVKSAPETNYVMMGAEDGKIKEDSAPSVAKSAPETNYVMMGAEDGKIKEDSAPSVAKSAPETNYVMMGAEDGKIKEDSAPAPTLESVHSNQPQPPSLALENLSLESDRSSGSTSERSRSRSGPGTSEGSKSLKKTEDGRAASACSSPISYSPPTSPTLGSLSSMSSLSEGGLSSASSTCTVVNVGMRTPAGVIPKITNHQALPNPPSATDPPIPIPISEPRSNVKSADCSFFCHVDPERGQCPQESK